MILLPTKIRKQPIDLFGKPFSLSSHNNHVYSYSNAIIFDHVCTVLIFFLKKFEYCDPLYKINYSDFLKMM